MRQFVIAIAFASTIKNHTCHLQTKVFNRACKADLKEERAIYTFPDKNKKANPQDTASLLDI